MEEKKGLGKNSKIVLTSICTIFIFAIGLFVGYQMNNLDSMDLQGYKYTTGVNRNIASTSNASTANASTANASTTNASGANAWINDNVLYIRELNFTHLETFKAGSRVGLLFSTYGACNSGATLVFESNNGARFNVAIKDINKNPYFIIPENVSTGTYSLVTVFLVGTNSDGKTFTKSVSYNKTLEEYKLKVINENASKYTLNKLKLKDTTAGLGEKVYIDVKANEPILSLYLIFKSSNGKTLKSYVKDISTTIPYIEIFSSVEPGNYELIGAEVFFEKANKTYTKDGSNGSEVFNFDSKLEVQANVLSSYIYSNESIDEETLTAIYNAPVGTSITIYADSDSFIKSEIFDSIKGKDKDLIINYKENQVLFNGRDIKNPKTIDVSVTVDTVKNNDAISKLVDSGIVVSFPDNGDLPGEAVVKIKASDEIDKQLENGGYVYFYNKLTKDFSEIKTDIEKTSDGYYKFNISHNSEYLLVKNKLPNKLIAKEIDRVHFIKGNAIYFALIGAAVLVIVAVVVFIIVFKKKNKKESV